MSAHDPAEVFCMTTSERQYVVYVLNQTVLAAGKVFERGTSGTAEEFGDAFHPLRTAGYLTAIDLNGARPVDTTRHYKTLNIAHS